MDPGDAREPVAKEVRLLVPIEKSESPKRVTYGVVLEPDFEDLQGDVMSAEDIEAAAYDWMERSQSGGHMHSELVEGAKVVESYIAPCDIAVETATGSEIIRKGSWVLAMRWPKEIWASIEKGDLTGYSVGGTGVRLALEEVGKHGYHDQKTHGNWAHPGAETSSYTGARPGSYVTFSDGTKARIVSIHADGAIEVKSPDLPGGGAMLLLPGQIDSEGNVDLAPKTHPGPYERPSAYGGMDPAARGAAAEGGGTPADQGMAAAQNESFPVYTEQIDSQGRIRQVRVEVPKEDHEYDAKSGYRQFEPGQKVRDNYGKTHTVLFQRGSQVFLDDSSQWIHPNNLWPVKKSDDLNGPVERPLTEIVCEGLKHAVAKHGSGDQTPHGNWARHTAETGKSYTTLDGVDMRDQPKVKRTAGGDFLETENGVVVSTRTYQWAHGKMPQIHTRARWGVFPMIGGRPTSRDPDMVIWGRAGETLPEMMLRLPKGEYELAT